MLLSCCWLVCFCMLVLRATACAFAVVCRQVAFNITRACGLHVCVVFVCVVFFLCAVVCLGVE